MLVLSLSIGAFLSGTGSLWAAQRNRLRGKVILKLGTMMFIIVLAAVHLTETGWFGALILLGLLFSLAGDAFLVLPRERFIPGLIAFFLGHVCYVLAFPAPWDIYGRSVLFACLLAAVAAPVCFRLTPGARKEGGKRLQTAVLLYVCVISLMVWKALQSGHPLLIAGALLFYISDAVLAWDRFIKRLPWRNFGVMIPYYAAQYLFALSLSTEM